MKGSKRWCSIHPVYLDGYPVFLQLKKKVLKISFSGNCALFENVAESSRLQAQFTSLAGLVSTSEKVSNYCLLAI